MSRKQKQREKRNAELASLPSCTRRELLKRAGRLGMGAFGLEALGGMGSLIGSANAEEAPFPDGRKKLIWLHREGGACKFLDTGMLPEDFGPRSQLSAYHIGLPEELRAQIVPTNPLLRLGPGWLPQDIQAVDRWKALLVKGVQAETASHEIERERALTGRLNPNLGERRFASAAKLLATDRRTPTRFVRYGWLGAPDIYNGKRDVADNREKLEAGSWLPLAQGVSVNKPESFASLIQGHQRLNLTPQTIGRMQALLSERNNEFFARQRPTAQSALSPLRTAYERLFGFFGSNYGSCFDLGGAIPQIFDFDGTGEFGPKFAAAFRAIQCNLTDAMVVFAGQFDQHTDFARDQLLGQRMFNRALRGLLNSLYDAGLADTTYIVITSEFYRLPYFNGSGGTDHHIGGQVLVLNGPNGDLPRGVVGAERTERQAGSLDAETHLHHGAPLGNISHENVAAALLRRLGHPAFSTAPTDIFQRNPVVDSAFGVA